MAKPASRAHSRYAHDAVKLLGLMIRSARIEQRVTVAELAERAGVSRGLLHRIERGQPGCSIGAVFELASVVGLRLFDAEPTTLANYLTMQRSNLTLLPQAARKSFGKVKEDF
ncbi:MAG: helix-turn-helix domain-containing protein [Gammaproteobacteria bacterium]|nr:helix-turn-helix domain-containing protein [Gammaproteobacteria bacterium]